MGFRVGECPPIPPEEYRVRLAPHARQSWGDRCSSKPTQPPLGQYYPGVDRGGGRAWATSWWLSAGVGQVNDEGERNE